MTPDWALYQEEVAAFFRSLGFKAETNAPVTGSRTSHQIDVLVRSEYSGFQLMWLVECKLWKTPVNKLHVLALRQIVIDAGADRGILLSEAGFQQGATEAANLTNVQLSCLADLRGATAGAVNALRLRDLYDRVAVCEERYWAIPKAERIAHGLRPEFYEPAYSGRQTIEVCQELIRRGMRGTYPFQLDTLGGLAGFGKDHRFENSTEVIAAVAPLVDELDQKLSACERAPR